MRQLLDGVIARTFVAVCAQLMALPAGAQALTEKVLGSLVLAGTQGPGIVVSRHGTQMARLERVVGGGERYVTFTGPGETFDRIVPGAAWIDDRLVYLAMKGAQAILVDGAKRMVLKGRPTSPQVLARNWPSADRHHYLSFVTNGKRIGWLIDGRLQPVQFDRLGNVNIEQPPGTPWFAGAKSCDWQMVGHPAFANLRWDMLHWARAADNGKLAYVYGERAGEALLQLNGKVIWREPIESFATSTDGRTWMAVVDRSLDGADRVMLLRNGVVVDQADVDRSRQRLVMSADGTGWLWELMDADYAGSTYRQPNKAPRRLSTPTAELVLSADGARLGTVRPNATQPGKVDIEVDGLTVLSADSVRSGSLRFGPASGYNAVVTTNGALTVVSSIGQGPAFDEISEVLSLVDGRPAYIARRGSDNYAVRGMAMVRLPVDDVHHLNSLRLDGDVMRVLATRGAEVLDLSIRD